MTAKVLEKMGVEYRLVIEPTEKHLYEQVVKPERLTVLPFHDLGLGSIPARNWVFEHSIANGDKRHWILDDNILAFYRLNRNQKSYVDTGTIFRCCEDFVDRYDNVRLASMEYLGLVKARDKVPVFKLNTRCYSCILIDNSISHRWRGRYNEDTDLSLRVLKDGDCTIVFHAFLAEKTTTMRMKGGNTDSLYAGDGRKAMAESLVEQHPDVARVTWKWGRWQHHVDYSGFKSNRLVRKDDGVVYSGINEYGMRLVQFDENGLVDFVYKVPE